MYNPNKKIMNKDKSYFKWLILMIYIFRHIGNSNHSRKHCLK